MNTGISVDQYYLIADELRELSEGRVPCTAADRGVCWFIFEEALSIEFEHDLFSILQQWPKNVGRGSYFPIEGGPEAYWKNKGNPMAMWGRGRYGCLRRELCAWMADEIEDMINEVGS